MAEGPGAKPTSADRYTKIIAYGTVALVLLTYLAFAANSHFWPFSSSPSPTLTPTPVPRSPGPTPTTSISSGPTSTGSVAFTGQVGITFSGIDFDSNPPGPGPELITWERYTYTLQGYGSVIVSLYPRSGASPTEAACPSWAQTHNSQILPGVNLGDQLCFITQDGRTVRFIVTNISSDAVDGQATVWNDGNQ